MVGWRQGIWWVVEDSPVRGRSPIEGGVVRLGGGVPKAGVGGLHRPEGIDADPPETLGETKRGGDRGHVTGDRESSSSEEE